MQAFRTRLAPLSALALAAALMIATGCSTLPKTGVLPQGSWAGDGAFVHEKWDEGVALYDPATSAGYYRGGYRTTLDIADVEENGEHALRVEILSMRGPFEKEDDDRTHLIVYLQPVKTLGDDATLYKAVDWQISMNADEPGDADSPLVPVNATCTRVDDDAIVFQIAYLDGFTDNYVFTADGDVMKLGRFGSVEDDGDIKGLIHWVETLEPVDD